MREWIQAQLAAGLPAFKGTTISGTIALKEELLNEVLSQWLAMMKQVPRSAAPSLDVSGSLGVVKRAAIRAETGTILVDFDVAV